MADIYFLRAEDTDLYRLLFTQRSSRGLREARVSMPMKLMLESKVSVLNHKEGRKILRGLRMILDGYEAKDDTRTWFRLNEKEAVGFKAVLNGLAILQSS